MYHFPFSFEFVPVVQKFAYQHISPNAETKTLFGEQLREIASDVNKELKFYKLPTLFSAHVFRRPAFCVQDIHKDVYFLNNGKTIFKNTAYNLPVYGCTGCYMEWVDGEYEEVFETLNLSENRTVHRFIPKWKNGPRVVERMEFTQPHFFKVNNYHRAIAGDQERVVVSLRFNENLSIEKYYEKLYKDDNTGVSRPEYYDILTTEDCFNSEVANNISLGYN